MTEATEVATDQAGAGAPSRRGRPRPQETLTRDERGLEILTAQSPMTTAQLAAAMDVKPSIAYLVVYRLKRDGLIRHATGEGAGRNTWEVIPTA